VPLSPHPVLELAQRACCDLSESNRVGKKRSDSTDENRSNIKPFLRTSSFFFFFSGGGTLLPISIDILFIPNPPIASLACFKPDRAICYIILQSPAAERRLTRFIEGQLRVSCQHFSFFLSTILPTLRAAISIYFC